MLDSLVHPHADLSLVDGPVEVLNRLRPVAIEIMLGDFQFMFGSPHMLQGFIDMWMSFRSRHSSRGHGSRSHHWRRRGFRSGCRSREGQRKENCCQDEQSQEPNLFHVSSSSEFRLGRNRFDSLLSRRLPRHPNPSATPAQYSR
ncbi:hypothetical protein SBA2_570007 [Acidobacteriia bacterium SbA2]|nr:hypothetical protein SBA2_570007 [Acidobacteriia bacterium SbA2]